MSTDCQHLCKQSVNKNAPRGSFSGPWQKSCQKTPLTVHINVDSLALFAIKSIAKTCQKCHISAETLFTFLNLPLSSLFVYRI